MDTKNKLTEAALRYHSEGRPGKIGIVPTKPHHTQEDLSLAYSPGVAAKISTINSSDKTGSIKSF